MPPQTRAAARRVVAPTPLDALPLPLALRIFALLPADARLLAAAVCSSWRRMLADPALWTRLDLSPASGVDNPTMALLQAAAARAGGQLEVLRVYLGRWQPHTELLNLLAANAGTMRELVLCTDNLDMPPSSQTLTALLRAAPGLRLMETGVLCRGAEALPVLRKEPPFGPLRLKRASFHRIEDIIWREVADGLSAHTSLESVTLSSDWPAAQAESDALVGALLSLPLLRSLRLRRAPAAVLARLLGCLTLRSLRMSGLTAPLLDSPASAALLCDALRANIYINTLALETVDLWHDMGAAAALLATLQAHPSLQTFCCWHNNVLPEHAAAAGAALGAIIAHSPALETLDITFCRLGDAGLGPIMDALPRGRHLQKLNCYGNDMSDAFARKRLPLAVRACAPLRTLDVGGGPAVYKAKLLLEQRR